MEAMKTITPDQGWAWVILASAFSCNVIFGGIIYSFGTFFVAFLEYFHAGRGKTSWIGSTIGGTYAIVGPLASILANMYGCRAVTIVGSLIAAAGLILSTFSPGIDAIIITFGLMGGIGFGLMYLCAFVMIGHYFERYRAFATGVAACGSGLGTFIISPLSVFLIQTYGWKGAMWVIAGIVLNGTVIGATFRDISHTSQSQDQGHVKNRLLDCGLLKNPTFLVFCSSSFLCLIGFFVPFMYLPDFARKHGISKEHGALLVSIIGITNTAGRIICGYISDKSWADALSIQNASLILGGIATICAAWFHTYFLLAIYATVFGLAIASYVSLCPIILVELLGLEKLSDSFGILNMFRGIATFIGAPLAGVLFDMTGDYEVAFGVAGTAIVAAGIISLPLRQIEKCTTRQHTEADISLGSYTELQPEMIPILQDTK